MEDYKEKFLEAEEQASKLVSQLDELNKETRNYKEASESLTETKNKLIDLIEKQQEVAGKLNDVVEASSRIGTLEILEKISLTNEQVEEAIMRFDNSESNVKRIQYLVIVIIVLLIIAFIVLFVVEVFQLFKG